MFRGSGQAQMREMKLPLLNCSLELQGGERIITVETCYRALATWSPRMPMVQAQMSKLDGIRQKCLDNQTYMYLLSYAFMHRRRQSVWTVQVCG